MKIAVVILNWNGRALLEQFLHSVTKFSPEAVIYVADNASEDDSVEYLRSHFPEVKIIQNEVNGGFAKGYNDALKHVDEDIFILLNSDVEVTPGWIPPLLAEFDKDPQTAVLQPKILDYRKREYFEYAGAAGGFLDSLGYPYCRGRIFETLEKDHGQYDDTEEVFWASGACMAIRKEAFYRAGAFDEDFFAHQEEIDLCWRINNLGLKVKAVGSSKVYHLGGGTLHSMNPKKTFYNFRNSLFNLLKNAPGKKFLMIILLRMVLDGLAGTKFLLELKPSHTAAIIQGHFSFYSHFKKILKKRRKIPQKKKYFHIRSVVLAYYLIGKRRFGDL
ncbi:glycosyltransferase family 2 protein [Salinimicrobium catena]|uniref:glycosyltransferase family 2 protein n=1 Tax=Salinimicrobium catena TaxID=390640 RepID=UPI002FE47CF1